MVDIPKLRGLLAEHGQTQKSAAKALNMDEHTFGYRMRTGVFTNIEIEKLCDLLSIENPAQIFFAKKVAHDATK